MEAKIKKKVVIGSAVFLALVIVGAGLTYYQIHMVSYPEELKAYLLNHPKTEILERFPDYFKKFEGPGSLKEISMDGYARPSRSLGKGESLLIYDDGDQGLVYLFFDDRDIMVAREIAGKTR